VYIPDHFKIDDEQEIFTFIEENAFGQLTSTVEGQLFSTHLPFILSEDRSMLLGHVGKQNNQWESMDNQEVLVTLQGPHDYISPSWYKSPGVPTWNYQAAHIYGKCCTFHEQKRIKLIIDELTSRYESAFESPWTPGYKASMLKGIVGFEIAITDIQCKYKLSQNRPAEDKEKVAEELQNRGSAQLARAMVLTNTPHTNKNKSD